MKKIFNWIEAPKLEKLQTIEKNGSRHYILPNGNIVPSMTTVLGFKKKKDLQKWVDRVGVEEAEKKRNQGAVRGNSIHDMMEKYVRNDPNYLTNVLPHYKEVFLSVRPYLDKISDIKYSEETVYSEKLGVAGRLDLLASYDNIPSIIDLKGATKARLVKHIDTYLMQLAGYSACYYELTGIPVKQGVIIMGVENNQPQIFKIQTIDYLPSLIKCIKEYQAFYK